MSSAPVRVTQVEFTLVLQREVNKMMRKKKPWLKPTKDWKRNRTRPKAVRDWQRERTTEWRQRWYNQGYTYKKIDGHWGWIKKRPRPIRARIHPDPEGEQR
jgi:hypothetical protein